MKKKKPTKAVLAAIIVNDKFAKKKNKNRCRAQFNVFEVQNKRKLFSTGFIVNLNSKCLRKINYEIMLNYFYTT